MKKKIISFLLIGTFASSVLACGKTNPEIDTQNQNLEETETEEDVSPLENNNINVSDVDDDTLKVSEVKDDANSPLAAFTFTDINMTMYAQNTVNVRSLPNTDGEKLGSLSTNEEVNVTGQCNETSWYRIEYNGDVAFVSNNYLGDNKIEIQASSENAPENDYSANSGGDKTQQLIDWAASIGYANCGTLIQVSDTEYILYELGIHGGGNTVGMDFIEADQYLMSIGFFVDTIHSTFIAEDDATDFRIDMYTFKDPIE